MDGWMNGWLTDWRASLVACPLEYAHHTQKSGLRRIGVVDRILMTRSEAARGEPTISIIGYYFLALKKRNLLKKSLIHDTGVFWCQSRLDSRAQGDIRHSPSIAIDSSWMDKLVHTLRVDCTAEYPIVHCTVRVLPNRESTRAAKM